MIKSNSSFLKIYNIEKVVFQRHTNNGMLSPVEFERQQKLKPQQFRRILQNPWLSYKGEGQCNESPSA